MLQDVFKKLLLKNIRIYFIKNNEKTTKGVLKNFVFNTDQNSFTINLTLEHEGKEKYFELPYPFDYSLNEKGLQLFYTLKSFCKNKRHQVIEKEIRQGNHSSTNLFFDNVLFLETV